MCGVRGAKCEVEEKWGVGKGSETAGRLLQEVFDALSGFFVCPVVISDLLGADDPLAVDQHRDGKADESIRASDLHVGIEQHWEGQSKLLHEVSDLLLRIWLDVDR